MSVAAYTAASVVLVVAVAENGVIGRNGALPWRLKSDMAHFRKATMGRPVVMGRKTWDSLPKKPLPGPHQYRRDARCRFRGAGSAGGNIGRNGAR